MIIKKKKLFGNLQQATAYVTLFYILYSVFGQLGESFAFC